MKTKKELVRFEQRGDVTVGVILTESVLGTRNVMAFGETVLEYVKKHPGLHLLLDFKNVSYLSSAVLSELIRIKRTIEETGGALRLSAMLPSIQKIFEITNLDKVFVIYNEGDALRAVDRYKKSLAIQTQDSAWTDPAHTTEI